MAANARHILVGYDGSDAARRALDAAAGLADYGSLLSVTSVADDETASPAAERLLDEAREQLLRQQVSARFVERVGDPAEELVETARELDVDLVVVGRRNHGALRRLVLGSGQRERRPPRALRRAGGSLAVRTRVYAVFAAVVGAAALIAGGLIALSLAGGRSEDEPARPVDAVPAVVDVFRGIPQQGTVLGSPRAPVTLVEYVDLQCPFCADFARLTFPTIVEEYVRPGHVRVVFRGLAFLGPESDAALRAALAAGQQGRLWNVVDLLYRSQGAENGGWVTEELLRSVADTAGLDSARMLRDAGSPAVERRLVAAREAATAAGVTGTPSFEVGPTGGALKSLTLTSFAPDALRAQLDALLAG